MTESGVIHALIIGNQRYIQGVGAKDQSLLVVKGDIVGVPLVRHKDTECRRVRISIKHYASIERLQFVELRHVNSDSRS
jgi:hypothetical protein